MFKLTIQGNFPEEIDETFQVHTANMWLKIAEMVDSGKTDGERHMSITDGVYTIVRNFVDQASAQEFVDLITTAAPPDASWAPTTSIEEVV